MKQLGWATIEQSKKLVEAGLDHNTADMHYCFEDGEIGMYDIDEITREHCILDVKGEYGYDEEYMKKHMIPCWSLGALIDLLPKTIETKKPKNLYFFEILPANNCVAYTALNERKEMVFLKMFATGVESDATLIDNMVSMICWLLNNNYIRKEK